VAKTRPGAKLMAAEIQPFTLYIEILRTALADGVITSDESAVLNVLLEALGLTPSHHMEAFGVIHGAPAPSPDTPALAAAETLELYQRVMVEVLDDITITEDEWDLLNILKEGCEISDEEHGSIMERVMGQFHDEGEAGLRQRYQRYLAKIRMI